MRQPALWMRVVRTAVATAATVLVLFALAAAAAGAERSTTSKGKTLPSYIIPNTVAFAMSLAVVASACKRFRRS